IEGLLEDMDRLLGPGRVQGVSASEQVRGLTAPAVPQTWTSKAADQLQANHEAHTRAGNIFAAADDDTKNKVDQAANAVASGKSQMGAIKDDYRANRDLLAPASSNPEVARRMAELDRQRVSDGANTLRNTLGRLPALGSTGISAPAGASMGGLGQLGQMMPAAMAPISAIGPAMLQPLNMLSGMQGLISPATSMLSGLNIPQQVTHQGTPPA
ncbi:hypothetical protein, partial [Mycobacteroides abscessus]|uniref:hypothetical protein n=1 Tax=Mycobacteroides abscessus TaxID=36809 RepID=UPI000515C104